VDLDATPLGRAEVVVDETGQVARAEMAGLVLGRWGVQRGLVHVAFSFMPVLGNGCRRARLRRGAPYGTAS
jgi:hypothetical protein